MEYRVNIYIETSRHGPSKGPGKYMYILEYVSKSGKSATMGDIKEIENNTYENELVLKAIITAIKRLSKPCSVTVFTSCSYVFNSINAGWPEQWKKKGWVRAGDKPIRNLKLWKELLEVMELHVVTYKKEEHPYKKWMMEQLKGE